MTTEKKVDWQQATLTEIPTDQLWTLTHTALVQRLYGPARMYLDELCRRDDNNSALCSPSAYVLPDGEFRAVLADRIEQVNAKVLVS